MIKKLNATFDGKVLRPDEPIGVKPNTRVRIIIETFDTAKTKGRSFLRTAQSLNLEGPFDWSDRFENHLYGRKSDANDIVATSYLAIVLKKCSDSRSRKYKVWSEFYDKIFSGGLVDPYIIATLIYQKVKVCLNQDKYSQLIQPQ